MDTWKLILTALMAGIYSGILDGVEANYGLSHFVSASILILLTFMTGYLLVKMRPKVVAD
ncbi:hypothetical protein [Ferdinandcohnia sp. Marseille-Q9671]